MWLANPIHSVAVPEQAAIRNQRFLKDAVSVLDKAIIGHKLYSLLSMLNKKALQKLKEYLMTNNVFGPKR